MKKTIKVVLIILIVLIILGITFFLLEYARDYENMRATLLAVIVRADEKSLDVMELNNKNLYSVSLGEDGNIGFKQGQEILIYFDGIILESFPGQIPNVEKIEIIKEKSETEIPDEVLRFYYNSKDKVEVKISDLTNKGLIIEIIDRNELPYDYANEYTIYKEVKNEDYTGTGEKIGEDTENSTSAYTGTGLEYIWEELEKNEKTDIKDTIEELRYNLPNMDSEYAYIIVGKKIDWTKVYGALEDGKYRIVFADLGADTNTFRIQIEILVDGRNVKITSIEKEL